MEIRFNDNEKVVNAIREGLKKKDGHCPCRLEMTEDTMCMCKDFRENVAVGEYCHCGLYKKIF